MKTTRFVDTFALLFFAIILMIASPLSAKLKVVATTQDIGDIARYLGGPHIEVFSIMPGDQDPHQVKPKPSLAERLADADLLLGTGLDLEMWLPTLVDKSGNKKIRDGQDGYVAISHGQPLAEVPTSLDRSQGDVHAFGNPHLHTSPLLAKVIARNIVIGLIKNDPANEAHYKERLKAFQKEIDIRMFGKELVAMVGGDTLTKLANSGKLISYLEGKKVKGKALIDLLGGWMKKAMPLRGMEVVTYHPNFSYFGQVFGLVFVGDVEPKPGIPPSARDVADLIDLMRKKNVKTIFAANYFDENKVKVICEKVGAKPAVVPLSVGGAKGAENYFSLIDLWIDTLLKAAGR